jgi:hypothetical protein
MMEDPGRSWERNATVRATYSGSTTWQVYDRTRGDEDIALDKCLRGAMYDTVALDEQCSYACDHDSLPHDTGTWAKFDLLGHVNFYDCSAVLYDFNRLQDLLYFSYHHRVADLHHVDYRNLMDRYVSLRLRSGSAWASGRSSSGKGHEDHAVLPA